MIKNILGKRWTVAAAMAAVCLTIGAEAADAAVLYSSPPSYAETSYQSSSAVGAEQECTPFTLAANSTITQVSFWGDYIDGVLAADSFTISLYAGGFPPASTALTTRTTTSLTRVDTGLTGARGLETYFYTATLSSPLTVTGGTNYAIAVLNSAATWNWQLGAAGTNYYRVGADGTNWTTSTTAFQDSVQLIGTAVPEPSTFALLAVAVVGAGAAWRRRLRA